MKEKMKKRLYEKEEVEEREGGLDVNMEGRKVKKKERKIMLLKKREEEKIVEDEFEEKEKIIDKGKMKEKRIVKKEIEGIEKEKKEVFEDIIRFEGKDMIW